MMEVMVVSFTASASERNHPMTWSFAFMGLGVFLLPLFVGGILTFFRNVQMWFLCLGMPFLSMSSLVSKPSVFL